MSAITMAGLSASQAEKILVQVWLLLEKHQVASPEVAVKSLSDHLQIRLRFTLKEDAELVGSELKDWAGKQGLRVHFMARDAFIFSWRSCQPRVGSRGGRAKQGSKGGLGSFFARAGCGTHRA